MAFVFLTKFGSLNIILIIIGGQGKNTFP